MPPSIMVVEINHLYVVSARFSREESGYLSLESSQIVYVQYIGEQGEEKSWLFGRLFFDISRPGQVTRGLFPVRVITTCVSKLYILI